MSITSKPSCYSFLSIFHTYLAKPYGWAYNWKLYLYNTVVATTRVTSSLVLYYALESVNRLLSPVRKPDSTGADRFKVRRDEAASTKKLHLNYATFFDSASSITHSVCHFTCTMSSSSYFFQHKAANQAIDGSL